MLKPKLSWLILIIFCCVGCSYKHKAPAGSNDALSFVKYVYGLVFAADYANAKLDVHEQLLECLDEPLLKQYKAIIANTPPSEVGCIDFNIFTDAQDVAFNSIFVEDLKDDPHFAKSNNWFRIWFHVKPSIFAKKAKKLTSHVILVKVIQRDGKWKIAQINYDQGGLKPRLDKCAKSA